MITKEKFIKLIEDYKKYEELLDSASIIFPNIFESNIFTYSYKWFDQLIEAYFNISGIDWINAYLFEDCRKYWIEDIEHKLESLEDLWNLVKDYRI